MELVVAWDFQRDIGRSRPCHVRRQWCFLDMLAIDSYIAAQIRTGLSSGSLWIIEPANGLLLHCHLLAQVSLLNLFADAQVFVVALVGLDIRQKAFCLMSASTSQASATHRKPIVAARSYESSMRR